MNEIKISAGVKTILDDATKIAETLRSQNVEVEHVILGVLSSEAQDVCEFFDMLNINKTYLHDMVYNEILTTDIKPKLYIERKPKYSITTKLLLSKSAIQCVDIGDAVVEYKHVLLAIFNTSPRWLKFFNEIGLTYQTIYNTIKENNITASLKDDDIDDESEMERLRRGKKPTSKNLVLDNFCRNISKMVANNELDLVVGRGDEIKRVSQILSRRKKNNPVLIGEAGVGKTAIIEGLAQHIHSGNVPRTIADKKIYSLDMASIVAGTKYRGQFEERMKAIIEECRNNKDIILFIDELHTIVGAGNSSGSLDASNIFKPALSRGELQIIGATTLNEYRENIETDSALTRRFQQVIVPEATVEETKEILIKIKDKYEKHHKVKYTDEAIEECVNLSSRYIHDRYLPDKAIDVLDEVGASVNIKIDKPDHIKKLEEKKRELTNKKIAVVNKQDYEKAAQLRDEERNVEELILKANEQWKVDIEKNVTVIGVDDVSSVVSLMTGIPLSKISVQESKKLLEMDKILKKIIIGQDEAIEKLVKAIKRSRLGIKDKNKPVSFLFLGNTGTGKTLLAKTVAKEIYGDDEALIRIDMSEYAEKHNVSRLIGSPPGYVGYEQGGQLTEKIRRKPHCVVLLDEIEKAHEDVYNILLQLLDEGHLTDGIGRKVDFKNVIVIMTSNIGAKEATMFGKGIGFQTSSLILNEENRIKTIVEKSLKNKFKPEFINRISEIIMFNRLTEENVNQIILCEIEKLKSRLKEINIDLEVDESVIKFVAKEGYDETYGARPISRAIQHHIEDPIADEILQNSLNSLIKIYVHYDDKIVIKSETNTKINQIDEQEV